MIPRRNVNRGIRFLNENYGRDWPLRVDPDAIDLGSGMYCILGQVEGYPGYFPGAVARFNKTAPHHARWGWTHGFLQFRKRSHTHQLWRDYIIQQQKEYHEVGRLAERQKVNV